MRVTRKPPKIEAWCNSPDRSGTIPNWIECACDRQKHAVGEPFLVAPTSGRCTVEPGFWVVKDEYGDIRVFTPAQFDELFELPGVSS